MSVRGFAGVGGRHLTCALVNLLRESRGSGQVTSFANPWRALDVPHEAGRRVRPAGRPVLFDHRSRGGLRDLEPHPDF
jgi:hypothetical protein